MLTTIPLRFALSAGLAGALLAGGLRVRSAPQEPRRPPRSRAEALARLPSEPGVLINIHRGLFPATWDLTLLGQKATPALRQALIGNTNAQVRFKAAQVLTQLRDTSALPELHRAVTDWSPLVRGQAIRALAEVGNAYSVPHLVKRIEDEQETLGNRIAAVRALGRIGDPTAAPAVWKAYTKALADKRDEVGAAMVRRAAVRAYWELRKGLPRAQVVKAMRAALVDRDPLVARRAAIAGSHLRDVGMLPALGHHLRGPNAMLRNVAAYVLGRIGDRRGVAPLEAALGQVRSGRLLNNIAFALQRLRAPKLWQHLQRLLRHPQAFIRLNAAYTVGEMRLGRAVPLLVAQLHDPSVAVRAQAVVALAKVGSPRAVPALLGLLRGKGAKHQRLALKALMLLSRAPKIRQRYLDLSTESRYRREAALVLAARGDRAAAPLLYPFIRYRPADRQGWQAVQTLRDPVLVQLCLAQLRGALAQGNPRLIARLVHRLGPRRILPHTQTLLAMLFRFWGSLDVRHPPYLDSLLAVLRVLGHSKRADVARWVRPYTHHKSYRVRVQAQVSLARMGDTLALRQLVTALANASDHHRPYLVRQLSQLPLARLRSGFAPIWKSPDSYLRLAMGAALFFAGDLNNPRLREALRAPQGAVRSRARTYLARCRDSACYARLKRFRDQEADPQARAELDDLVARLKPVSRVFREFTPRQVVLR